MYEALRYYCILYQGAYIVWREGMRGKKKRGREKKIKKKKVCRVAKKDEC